MPVAAAHLRRLRSRYPVPKKSIVVGRARADDSICTPPEPCRDFLSHTTWIAAQVETANINSNGNSNAGAAMVVSTSRRRQRCLP